MLPNRQHCLLSHVSRGGVGTRPPGATSSQGRQQTHGGVKVQPLHPAPVRRHHGRVVRLGRRLDDRRRVKPATRTAAAHGPTPNSTATSLEADPVALPRHQVGHRPVAEAPPLETDRSHGGAHHGAARRALWPSDRAQTRARNHDAPRPDVPPRRRVSSQSPAWTLWYRSRKVAPVRASEPPQATFVPVRVTPEAARIEVVLASGGRLLVPVDASVDVVRTAIMALRSAC